MAMASLVVQDIKLGRRSLLGAALILAGRAARAQNGEVQFKRSSLVIDTGARQIKFDV